MTLRRAAQTVFVSGLAAGILLAGCGGDDSSAGGADEPIVTTTAADDGAAQAALDAAMLTPADLATGDALDAVWVEGNVSDGVDIELPACVVEEPGAGAVVSAEATLITQNDFKLPSLEEDVSVYEGTGASDAFAAAAARLDGCTPVFVFQGTESPAAIERLPLTLPGDQSAAWRTSVTIAGANVAITSIHVQAGDHELALVHVDLGAPEPAVLEGYVAKAVAKLAG
jgi:hypothetical protein